MLYRFLEDIVRASSNVVELEPVIWLWGYGNLPVQHR